MLKRETAPDHSWLSKTRNRLTHEVHEQVFGWLMALLAERGLVMGVLIDNRLRKNSWHGLSGLLCQSVYGRLAGYEYLNAADRLGRDPAIR